MNLRDALNDEQGGPVEPEPLSEFVRDAQAVVGYWDSLDAVQSGDPRPTEEFTAEMDKRINAIRARLEADLAPPDPTHGEGSGEAMVETAEIIEGMNRKLKENVVAAEEKYGPGLGPPENEVARLKANLRKLHTTWADNAIALIQSQKEEIGRLQTKVRDYHHRDCSIAAAHEAEIERLKQAYESKYHEAYTMAALHEKAEAERGALRKFFETLALDTWDILDFDGGDFQDSAEKLGLIVLVPADEQFKAEYDADEMYVWAWNPLATRHLEKTEALSPSKGANPG